MQQTFVNRLFTLTANTEDKILQKILLEKILEESIDWLEILSPEAHNVLVVNLFKVINKCHSTKSHELIGNTLRAPVSWLNNLATQEACQTFIDSFFNLASTNDQLKLVVKNIFDDLNPILQDLTSENQRFFIDNIFKIANAKIATLTNIALDFLSNPLNFLDIILPDNREFIKQQYLKTDFLSKEEKDKVKIILSDTGQEIIISGYLTINDLKTLTFKEVERLMSPSAKKAYGQGKTLTFLMHYPINTQEYKKLSELYKQDKNLAEDYQIKQGLKAIYNLHTNQRIIDTEIDKFTTQLISVGVAREKLPQILSTFDFKNKSVARNLKEQVQHIIAPVQEKIFHPVGSSVTNMKSPLKRSASFSTEAQTTKKRPKSR